ncbi:MAG: hypothetical protein HFG22_13935 [Lachnospiraceae bacterium]|nr:hypothetical protein [Lachnospiraceae bacterium]
MGKEKRSDARKIADENLSKVFGERLKNLLIKHHEGKNKKEWALIILEKIDPDKAHICTSPLDKAYATRKIINWIDGFAMPDSISILLDICDLLDCEPGYLLGKQEEYHRGIISASTEIGLNDESIRLIKNYPMEIKKLLDGLILNGDDRLLKLLNTIYTYVLEAHHSIIRLEVEGSDSLTTQLNIEDKFIGATPNTGNTLFDISRQMLKYSATSTLDKILTDVYNQYIDEANKLFKERLTKKGEIKKKRIVKLMHDRKWRELTTEESVFLYEYGNMTEDEISDKVDEEINCEYKRYKEKVPNNSQYI